VARPPLLVTKNGPKRLALQALGVGYGGGDDDVQKINAQFAAPPLLSKKIHLNRLARPKAASSLTRRSQRRFGCPNLLYLIQKMRIDQIASAEIGWFSVVTRVIGALTEEEKKARNGS
jgi:hypothetical protein